MSSLRLRLAALGAVAVAVLTAVLLGPLRPAAAADAVPGVGQAGSDRVLVELRGINDGSPLTATSYEASVTQPAPSGGSGGGGSAGKATFSNVVFRHAYDANSPQIARTAATGRRLPAAVFTVSATGGSPKLRITLRDVLVVGSRQYLPDVNADERLVARVPMLEEVSLSYGAIEWCSYAAGSSTPTCTSFDVAQNR